MHVEFLLLGKLTMKDEIGADTVQVFITFEPQLGTAIFPDFSRFSGSF